MSTPTQSTRVNTGRRIVSVLAGAALLLSVPAIAMASSSRTLGAHHFGTKNGQTVLAGRIVSLGSGSVVIRDEQGFWRTIVVSPSTTYTEGPMKVAPAASASNLAVGAKILASGVVDANHTSLDATSIRILLDTVAGIVKSITPSTIVVKGMQSSMQTIDITAQTIAFNHSGVIPTSTVVPGAFVIGFGVLQPDGSLLALYLGVGTNRMHFDHDEDFTFMLPNKFFPHHFGRHHADR